MADSFIIVELKLVLLNCTPAHHTHQHPRTHVEPCQLDKYFPFGLAYFYEARPVHLLTSSFDYSIANSVEVFAGIRS